MNKRIILLMLVVGGILPGEALAGSQVSRCVGSFQSKRFAAAGKCFRQAAESLDASKGRWDRRQKRFRGRALLNSAVAFRRAAATLKKSASPSPHRTEQSAYFLEQAARAIQQYLDEDLAPSKARARAQMNILVELRRQIGYAQLVIDTQKEAFPYQIEGYHYHERKAGNQKLRLRPGSYLIRVLRGSQKPAIYKVQLKRNTRHEVKIRPPQGVRASGDGQSAVSFRSYTRQGKPYKLPPRQRRTSSTVWPIVFYGLSGAGLALFVYFGLQTAGTHERYEEAYHNPSTSWAQVQKLSEEGSSMQILTFVSLGGALALGITAVILQLTLPSRSVLPSPELYSDDGAAIRFPLLR
jgi:hypothetical protein